jgi:hypothetical protein
MTKRFSIQDVRPEPRLMAASVISCFVRLPCQAAPEFLDAAPLNGFCTGADSPIAGGTASSPGGASAEPVTVGEWERGRLSSSGAEKTLRSVPTFRLLLAGRIATPIRLRSSSSAVGCVKKDSCKFMAVEPNPNGWPIQVVVSNLPELPPEGPAGGEAEGPSVVTESYWSSRGMACEQSGAGALSWERGGRTTCAPLPSLTRQSTFMQSKGKSLCSRQASQHTDARSGGFDAIVGGILGDPSPAAHSAAKFSMVTGRRGTQRR